MRSLKALRLWTALAALVTVAAPVSVLRAQASATFDPHQVFTQSNQLFASNSAEELRAAALGYRSLLAHGYRNGSVYYNLGNTFHRLGEHGRAILNFRRALIYDPYHARAEAMLNLTREEVPDRFQSDEGAEILDRLFFWHHEWSFSTKVWVLIVSLGLFWILLGARVFNRFPLQTFLLAICAVLAIASGGSLLVEALSSRGQAAVVVAAKAEVFSNSHDRIPIFEAPIKSGVEVQIVDSGRSGWYQVRFPGGTLGWIEESVAEVVRPEGG